MPFFPEGQDPLGQEPGRLPLGVNAPDPFAGPTPGETYAAAFRQNNPVVSVLDALTRSSPDMTPVPGYDPIPRVVGSKYEPYIHEFIDDRNPAQTDARMAKIDAEEKDQQTLAASGAAGTVASIAAGATDPTWFIPILSEARAAGEGLSIAARIARGATEGALKSGVSESALMASQATRTPGEAAADIGTNTILMGLLGGAARWLEGPERAGAVDGLEATRRDLSPGEGPKVDLKVNRAEDGFTADAARNDGTSAAYSLERTEEGYRVSRSEQDAAGLPLEAQSGPLSVFKSVDDAEAFVRKLEQDRPAPESAPPMAPDAAPAPRALASDLSAAASDQRDMQLSRIGLPQSTQEALRQVPGLSPAIDWTTAALMHFSPTLRIFSSASLVAKRAMGDMAETALRFTQSARGITTARGGVPIDRLVKQQAHEMKLTSSHILRDQFLAYRKIDPKQRLAMARTAVSDFRGQTPDKMSFDDFKREVSFAGYNGDQHAIPEVANAARAIRASVLDPIKAMAQRTMGPDGKPMMGEALEPPKGDKSFWPRLWNKQAIAARYNEIKKTVSDWLESEQGLKVAARDRLEALQKRHDALGETAEEERAAIRAKIEQEIKDWRGKTTNEAVAALKAREKAEAGREEGASPLKSANKAVDAAVKKILESDKLDLSREELESRAAEILDRINAAPDGRIPYDIASGGPHLGPPGEKQNVRGSLQQRDFAIPTSLVRDFVETDAEHILSAHLRTALPDIHLTDRFGDVEMEDVFRRLNEEYDAKRSAAGDSQKKLKTLDDERKAMNRDLAATRDRIRGVYGWELAKTQPNAARIANAARSYNLIADLGTSVFNRMTDSINGVYRHGFMGVMGDAYLPFVKSLVGMEKEFGPAAKQSMRDAGVGIDSALGHLSHQFGDVLDDFRPGSKFERALAWAADKSMIVNLHGPWTDAMKTIGGTAAAANLLRTAGRVAGGSASEKDIQTVAQAGIEPFMARRIWEAYSNGGGQEFGKGTHVANTAAWTDAQARTVFRAAIARDADMSVLTPGLEKPLWMSGPVVSLLGQYKSFVAAAHEKLLISNLQQMDGRTLQGLAASLGMGMLSYRAYTLLSGAPASDRPQDWIKEGISRSAILGWFTEINSMQAKFTGGKTDMFRAIGADHPLSRRATNGALSEMLGPTYAKLEGLAGGLNDVSHGTWTAMDTHKLRQALFLQNLFAVRRLFDAAEDGFNSRLGIKPLNRDPSLWPAGPQTKQ